MDYFNDEAVKLEMQRNKRKVRVVLFSIIFLVICFIGYGVYWTFWDINRLPKGEFISQSSSPDGHYTIKAYLSNGGATTDFAVRAELVTNTNAHRVKNIYWNYHEQSAKMVWIDNDTVEINGHKLNLPYEKYDFRTH
jgi:hypothetical protein